MNIKSEKGFTLVEIMVVVVILGVLAGLVMPKLLSRPDEARITKTKMQIQGLTEALSLYKIDNGLYPSTEQGLDALVTKPSFGKIPKKYRASGYMPKIPSDAWGNEFIYLSPGPNGEFDIVSYGADGEKGGEGKDGDINNWEIE